jgi:CheY-like chemotaxis protein
MDGITTLNQLQKISQTANTLMIFITAKAQPDEIAQYISLAAVGVTAKPFDPMELVAGIEHNRTHDHEQ